MSLNKQQYSITPNIRANSNDEQFRILDINNLPGIYYRPQDCQQSIHVGNGIYRRANTADALCHRFDPNIKTAYDVFANSVKKFGDRPCFGKRSTVINSQTGQKEQGPFVFETYDECYTRARNIAAGLIYLGVTPKSHVAIYSKNRVEWQLACEACNSQSMVSISLYDSLGSESSVYIMNHGEVSTLFVSGECFPKSLQLASQFQFLKLLICFDEISQEDRQELSKQCGEKIQLVTLEKVEQLGQENPTQDVPPTADDLASIMYTSGTTGLPKGVMISHRNFVAAVTGFMSHLTYINETDSYLSYLPLAHILERSAEATLLCLGVSIGYWSGDIKFVRDDLATLKPTLFTAVPRVLDRFYDLIRSQVLSKDAGFIKRLLFQKAYKDKKYTLEQGNNSTPLWDWLIFSKIKSALGGRVRAILSGGAPLRPETQEFLTIALDCPVNQGYGLTETCAAGTVQIRGDMRLGNAGAVLSCCEIKLDAVPEMNYFPSNNQGEVCFRGPNVTLGYYKDPEKTKEVFDDDGFYHTGDIGEFDTVSGTLKIIDRKKNIFKLSQGEYVAVENLELKLSGCPFASKFWLYGDSTKSCLLAFVSANAPVIIAWAKENGLSNTEDIKSLCENNKVKEEMMRQIRETAKQQKFHSFEIPKAVHIHPIEFDQISGAQTPSLKLVRNVLKSAFDDIIQNMYASLNE